MGGTGGRVGFCDGWEITRRGHRGGRPLPARVAVKGKAFDPHLIEEEEARTTHDRGWGFRGISQQIAKSDTDRRLSPAFSFLFMVR